MISKTIPSTAPRFATMTIAPSRRRGLTLVELCGAMVIASTIFGISVQLLSLAMRATESSREHVFSTASLSRLAEQFRADVHTASSISVAKLAGEQIQWTVKLSDDERIEYELADGALRRIEYRADKVHARDAFALPAAADLRLDLQPAENPAQATLLVKRDGNPKDDAAGYVLRIDARLGRDRRFAAKASVEKAS